jgi:PPOX class probable F420-dependent enzyme
MAEMSETELASFLSRTRQGVWLTTNSDGDARGVPVWFDWDGTDVRVFSDARAVKVARLRDDPRVSMLVANDLLEPPMWVRFDGHAEIDADVDAKVFATEVLAPRYWDLDAPEYAGVVEQWRQAPGDALVVIRLRPERVRSNRGD